MKKIKLDPFISALLFEHDCVIISDFGGFVANYKPSFIHPVHHTISPPSKKIAFNASLKTNDGLLASYIAENNALSYQEACKWINRYVEESLNLLSTGKKLHIERIGSLFYNTEKKIQFSPDYSTNYLLDSFGLTIMHSPTIRRDVAVKKLQEKLPEPRQAVLKNESKKQRFSWRWMELIPAAAVLTLLFLNPLVVKNLNDNVAGLLPEIHILNPMAGNNRDEKSKPSENFISPAKEIPAPPGDSISATEIFPSGETNAVTGLTPSVNEKPEEVVSGKNTIADENKMPPVVTDKPLTNQPNKNIPESVTSIAETSVSYFIVAGCFRIEENANHFHDELLSKGFPSQLIGKYKGLHVVTFQNAATATEAKEALAKLKEQNLEAWVLKK